MTQNQPTLSPRLALVSTLVALLGLARALVPGMLAADRPAELVWLALFGIGLVPSLLLLRLVELPSRGFIEASRAYMIVAVSLVIGVVWLALLASLRSWRHKLPLDAGELLIAGLCLSYLILPLAHYLFLVPSEYRYISASSNFFAYTPIVQLVSFLVATLLAVGTAHLQRALQ